METVFMVYNLVCIMKMTVYTIWLVCLKGRASAISFYGFEWTSWIWNTRVSLFEKPDFTQVNFICRYLDLWLLVNCESDYSSHTILWSAWHSPRFRALPPTPYSPSPSLTLTPKPPTCPLIPPKTSKTIREYLNIRPIFKYSSDI